MRGGHENFRVSSTQSVDGIPHIGFARSGVFIRVFGLLAINIPARSSGVFLVLSSVPRAALLLVANCRLAPPVSPQAVGN